MSDKLWYRDFNISHPLTGTAYGYVATHKDYDGPEDDRCFHSFNSIREVLDEVDEWHLEQEAQS